MPQRYLAALAHAGYGARGFVYLVLGGVAVMSAIWGGGAEDTSGALTDVLGWPFGRVLVGMTAVGLVGYVLWKLAQGLLNADHADDDVQGFSTRAGQLVSAGGNLFLVLTAARLAYQGSSGSGNGEEKASAWLLQQPFGSLLLGVAAAAVIGAGAVQVWYGASGGYRKRLLLPAQHKNWMDQVCRFGLMARGVVFAIIGAFLGSAAWTLTPEHSMGTAEALNYIRGLPFGAWLYGLIAVGLTAFGAYGLIQARYRHIRAPEL